MTPYPGSPLYYQAIEQGLLSGCGDFYENRHVNSDLLAVNFTDLSDDDFHRCLLDANRRLMDNYFKRRKSSIREEMEKLYKGRDADFRGFRQS